MGTWRRVFSPASYEPGSLESSPVSFELRDATVRDVAALAALHVETFHETHGGGPPVSVREAQWQRILGAHDATDFTVVVEDAGQQLVAFARGTRHDGGVPGYQGELDKIYVVRRCHGQGLGRVLVREVAGRFLRQGVNVDAAVRRRTKPVERLLRTSGCRTAAVARG